MLFWFGVATDLYRHRSDIGGEMAAPAKAL